MIRPNQLRIPQPNLPNQSKILPPNQSRAIQPSPSRMMLPSPSTQHRLNYILTNRFYVEIGSEIKASFSECSGFGVNLKKESLLEGGVNDRQHVLIGHAEFDNVTLKRGMTNDLTFWKWLSTTLTDFPKKRYDLNILMFNQAGETQLAWSLLQSIPVSWKAPALQAESSAVAIEELTLAYEGIELILPERQSQNQPNRPGNQLPATNKMLPISQGLQQIRPMNQPNNQGRIPFSPGNSSSRFGFLQKSFP